MDSIKSQIDFVSGQAIRSGFHPQMEHGAPVALISGRSEPETKHKTRLKLVSLSCFKCMTKSQRFKPTHIFPFAKYYLNL